MNAPVYCLQTVQKSYDGRLVVDLERLEVRPGEVLTLVGPSGAGKSTLLRLLNFLEPPTAGTIVYRGHSCRDQHVPLALRREITTVFQRPILLRGTVRRNAGYGLRLRGRHDPELVERMLAYVGLGDLAEAPARRLSGGELQRVALARAMVLQPTVLLLDEPTANLDPYNVALIEDIVRRRNREAGTTVVLVTHNVFQAKRLGTRVGLMLAGRLVEIGAPLQFFDAPTDPRTRAFLCGELVY